MNNEHVLIGGFEGIKSGPGKYRYCSAATTVDPAVTCVHLNKRFVLALAPVSKKARTKGYAIHIHRQCVIAKCQISLVGVAGIKIIL